MILIESDLWNVLANFIFCYNILLIILLLFSFIKNKKIKSETRNWIYTLNTLLPLFCSIYFVSFLAGFFYSWYGQSYEWYSYTDFKYKYGLYLFFGKLFLPLLIGMLFFIKRLRLNFVLIFIYLFAAHFNLIEEVIMKLTRDYLPSGWSTYYDDSFAAIVIKWVLPLVFILLTYFLLHKRSKLPYPSAFLKNHVQ